MLRVVRRHVYSVRFYIVNYICDERICHVWYMRNEFGYEVLIRYIEDIERRLKGLLLPVRRQSLQR